MDMGMKTQNLVNKCLLGLAGERADCAHSIPHTYTLNPCSLQISLIIYSGTSLLLKFF